MASRTFRKLLKHLCDLESYTEGTADSHGQTPKTWATLASNVPCLFMPRTNSGVPGGERTTVQMSTLTRDDTLFMAYRTDIAEKARVKNIRTAAGTVLEAGPCNIRLVKDAAGQEHHLEIHIERGPDASQA